MERKDWNLIVVCAGNGQPIGPAQLQKSLFLLRENIPASIGSDFYSFAPYKYGPFCSTVYNDSEELSRAGLIQIGVAPGGLKQFSPTREGLDRARQLETQLPSDIVQYVHAAVQWALSLSFPDLVRAIYKAYPDYRSQSIFRG